MSIADSGNGAVDLSIIIINWHSFQYVIQCLHSIFANPPNATYEVIVVDNASFDQSERLIKRDFPIVLFWRTDRNLGFAAANNAGALSSHGRYLLFLNPDTEVLPNALSRLASAIEGLERGGILGAHLHNTDHSIQDSAIQAFPTITNQLLDSAYLRRKFPQSRLWGTSALYASGENPKQVDAVSGACILIKRSIFERIGGFSEEYFMYSEDIDLCYKARLLGYQNYLIPNAEIVHHGGGSSNTGRKAYYDVLMRKARWRYFRKFKGLAYALAFRYLLGLLAAGRAAVAGLAALARKRTNKGAEFSSIFKKWSLISLWCLFCIEPSSSANRANL